MKCQRCPNRATVHLAETIQGDRREFHLCSDCAKIQGLKSPDPPILDTILDQLIKRHVGELIGETARLKCPYCGLTYMEFRASGRLGCPNDYQLFDQGLSAIIRNLHGAGRHVGKMPQSRQTRASESPRLWLRAQLREAIADEDFERAAELRDTLMLGDDDR